MVTIRVHQIEYSQIEAVIFDKDGTLEDSESFLRELGIRRSRLIDAQIPGSGEPLLMAFGIQGDYLDPTGLMAVGSRLENEIAAAAYIAETGRGWFEARAIAHHAFVEADQYLLTQAFTSPLFVGSLEVLQSLSQAGLKLGILSADSTAKVEAFVQRHQLSPYIQLMMGSDRGLSKPDPALFHQACAALRVDPQVTLMVGDSQGDMVMAKQAGAAGAIGICWGTTQPAHLESADITITQLDDIQVKLVRI